MYFSTIKLKNSVVELKLQTQVALTGLGEKQNKTEQRQIVWVKKGRWTCKELEEGVNLIKTLMKLSKN